MILGDGTVIPSYFGTRDRGVPEDTGELTNTSLRVGEVRKIIHPGDEASISKKVIEYIVEVQHRDGNEPGTTSMYAGCTISNLFGGAGDFFRYTLRPDNGKKTGEGGIGVGAKVLLLCVNGSTNRAVIIGGVPDTHVDDSPQGSQGHNLAFEFNGIGVTIDSDGQLQVKFRGKTHVDGSLAADDNGPTTVSIYHDGTFEVKTRNGLQYIQVNQSKHSIDIQADESWRLNVSGTANFEAADDMRFISGSNITADIEGDYKFFSNLGAFFINVRGKTRISSAGVEIGLATDAMLKGTSFRLAQTTQHATMAAALTAAGTALTVAAGLMVVPVVGAMAASVPLAAAATQLVTAAGAISAFEAASPTFLSLWNKLD
jgi:hypothetical protein